jgi:hypothetical protein
MDTGPEAESKAAASGVRKTRYRVTVPDEPVAGGEESPAPEPAEPAPATVMVEGSAFPRPLTEPVPGTKPGRHRTFFVYADTREEAEHRVRQATGAKVPVTVEEAGHVDEAGRVHVPREEERAVQASMQDGRKAPGK